MAPCHRRRPPFDRAFKPFGDPHFERSSSYTEVAMPADLELGDLVRRLAGSHRSRYKPRGLFSAALLYCPKCERLWTRVRPKHLRTFCTRCPPPLPDDQDDVRRESIATFNRLANRAFTKAWGSKSTWIASDGTDRGSLAKWGAGSAREIERALHIEKGRPEIRCFRCLMLELPDRTFAFFTEHRVLMAWIKTDRAIELPFFEPGELSVSELKERLGITRGR
jgi:hypothetical protein